MTNVPKKISELKPDMQRWRHRLHQEPELAFDERKTHRFIVRQLQQFGVDDVHVLAKTGIVAVLHGKGGAATPDNGKKSIMLRAEMDALPINEDSGVLHASRTPGVHHACGHDGHMAMLLGAAKHLAEAREFDGTVYIVFQPAEEHIGGASEMIKEGLFKHFPADEVYGLHNHPALPLGMFATTKGAMLATSDEFHITLKGSGGHASDASTLTDLAGAMSAVISGMAVIAKETFPRQADPAVLAVCSVRSETNAANIMPASIEMNGTLRSFDPAVHAAAKQRIAGLITKTAQDFNAQIAIEYKNGYPLLVNTDAETDFAITVAQETAGADKVMTQVPKTLGVEDFAAFLNHKPGNFMAIGTGKPDAKDAMDLHTAKYDFNDAALPLGAAYWVRLVEKALPLPVGTPPAAGNPPPPPAPKKNRFF